MALNSANDIYIYINVQVIKKIIWLKFHNWWMFIWLSTNGLLHFILSDIKALEFDKLVIMTS